MNIEDYPAIEPANMENFGSLQYIIDRLPKNEQAVLYHLFVCGDSITETSELLEVSKKVICRILRNLRKINLADDAPMFRVKGKLFALKGLSEHDYRS